jgi:hypothetical protein
MEDKLASAEDNWRKGGERLVDRLWLEDRAELLKAMGGYKRRGHSDGSTLFLSGL